MDSLTLLISNSKEEANEMLLRRLMIVGHLFSLREKLEEEGKTQELESVNELLGLPRRQRRDALNALVAQVEAEAVPETLDFNFFEDTAQAGEDRPILQILEWLLNNGPRILELILSIIAIFAAKNEV